MAKKIYTIAVKTLSQNGISCRKVDVDFEKPECSSIKCDFDGKKIKVTVPEGCEGECIYATVRCLDSNCGDCPDSERIKICPCDSNTQCAECEECVGNICVSKCENGKVCDNDRCVDCDEDNPCDCNQNCVGGDCQCAPELPFINDRGCCVECLTDGDCPPCTICTPDGCVPVNCPDACDPITGDCVECNNSGDCTGENERCVDKKCECAPGFVRDPFTKECVPAPDCEIDSDCDECEICNDGICEPITCPEGYICVEGECKKICDCEDATCSKTEACVTLDTSNCYCNECEGDCAENADCGEGCYCKNGTCVPKPCKGSCENGADCGEGCGCQDGECVPCDSLDCNTVECEEVLGCGCTGTGCRDVGGCSGDCDSVNDCGPGCTCYKGTCVPCADFACDTNDCNTQPGCECNNAGKCVGDDRECEDVFEVTKIDETCDVEAELTTEDACSCSKITANTVLKSVGLGPDMYNLAIDVELRKGSANSLAQAKTLPKLNDTTKEDIADNETPTNGTVKVLVQPFYDEYALIGGVIKKVATNVPGPITEKSVSFNNILVTDTASFTNINVLEPGTFVSEFLSVNNVKVTVQQSTDLIFPNNCTYEPIQIIDTFTVRAGDKSNLELIAGGNTVLRPKYEGFIVLESDGLRYPLFTWFRSTDGQYDVNDIIRKLYVPVNQGSSTDILYGPVDSPKGKYPLVPEEGGLRSGKYFAVNNDCSCDNDFDLGKLVFCNPTELFYEARECNTKIKLEKPFVPCSVNQDLAKFGVNDPSSQVKYELRLNGQLVATFVDKANLGMVIEGTNQTMFQTFELGGEIIREISLKINHDDANECTLVYLLEDLSDVEIDTEVDCDIQGAAYNVYINKTNQAQTYNITNVVVTSVPTAGAVVEETTRFRIPLVKGVESRVTVTFSSGCTKDYFFNEKCCDSFEEDGFTFTQAVTTDGSLQLDLNITGGTEPYNIRYIIPNNIYVVNYPESSPGSAPGSGDIVPDPQSPLDPILPPVSFPPFTLIYANENGIKISDYASGEYSVRVIDSLGCTKIITLYITKVQPPTITIDGYSDFCVGGSTNVNINGGATAVGGVISYTDNGVSKSITLNSQGKAIIPNITVSRTYVFNSILLGSNNINIGETVVVQQIATPTATISTSNNLLCQGDSTNLIISGTIGAVVNVSNYPTPITIGLTGETIVTVSPTVTTTYQVLSTTLSGCGSGSGNSTTIQVAPPVEINLLDSECNPDLTLRTLTFDNITSATNQNGGVLTVVGNTVTVDPDTVTQVNVTYVTASCTKFMSFDVLGCECLPLNYSISNQGSICEGEADFVNPLVINLGETGYNVEITNSEGDVLYGLDDLGLTFTMPLMIEPAVAGMQLFAKITNGAVPTCFIDGIVITPTVYVIPPVGIFTDSNLCVDQDIVLYTNLNNSYTYEWAVENLDTTTDVTPVDNENGTLILNVDTAGEYEVTVTVTNAFGCSETISIPIDIETCVNPCECTPTLNYTVPGNPTGGATLDLDGSCDGYTWTWQIINVGFTFNQVVQVGGLTFTPNGAECGGRFSVLMTKAGCPDVRVYHELSGQPIQLNCV